MALREIYFDQSTQTYPNGTLPRSPREEGEKYIWDIHYGLLPEDPPITQELQHNDDFNTAVRATALKLAFAHAIGGDRAISRVAQTRREGSV